MLEGYMERIKQKLGLSDAREWHQCAIEYAKLKDVASPVPPVHLAAQPRRSRTSSDPQA